MATKSYYDDLKERIAHGIFEYADVGKFPDLQDFLGNLVRLTGVPIHYMLPAEQCIPLEKKMLTINQHRVEVEAGQIRFFFLDKNWISQLIKGAISFVADENTRMHLRALAMDGNFTVAAEYKDTLRRGNPEFPIKLDSGSTKVDLEPKKFQYEAGKPQPTAAQKNFYYSGFLMRSSLIAHWPGIEIRLRGGDMWDAQQKTRPLRIVRMERLADDMLFVICEGVVTSIQIKQPVEMIHFARPALPKGGKDVIKASDNRCMDFANLGTSPLNLVGTFLAKPQNITIPVTISN